MFKKATVYCETEDGINNETLRQLCGRNYSWDIPNLLGFKQKKNYYIDTEYGGGIRISRQGNTLVKDGFIQPEAVGIIENSENGKKQLKIEIHLSDLSRFILVGMLIISTGIGVPMAFSSKDWSIILFPIICYLIVFLGYQKIPPSKIEEYKFIFQQLLEETKTKQTKTST